MENACARKFFVVAVTEDDFKTCRPLSFRGRFQRQNHDGSLRELSPHHLL